MAGKRRRIFISSGFGLQQPTCISIRVVFKRQLFLFINKGAGSPGLRSLKTSNMKNIDKKIKWTERAILIVGGIFIALEIAHLVWCFTKL